MVIYDDKTQGIIKSGSCFFINSVKSDAEVVFRASYIVGSNLHIDGKITASFDLIVLGDVEAQDIDVKGGFICLGNCNIDNSITVQGKMFGKSVRAKHIDVHDEMIAQEIDVEELNVDGNIILGQTLAVEISAESGQKILCGETAYGAGKISAYEIITGEELDMDGGMKAVVEPSKILVGQTHESQTGALGKKYAMKNDYNSYLTELRKNDEDKTLQTSIIRWQRVLNEANGVVKQSKFVCYDIGILLSLIELSNSIYFRGWEKIAQWQQSFLEKFNKMANGEELEIPKSLTLNGLAVGQRIRHNIYGIGTIQTLSKGNIVKATVSFESGKTSEFQMNIAIKNFTLAEDKVLTPTEILNMLFIQPKEYGEWISYLNVLRIYGDKLSKKLYNISMELLYSAIGIKSKFMMDRLQENGWEDNV